MELPGHKELAAAKATLTADAGERSNLFHASRDVWSALFHRDDWPPELQQEADAIQPALFRYGTIEMTIARMNDAELVELSRALLAFIEAAERAA